MNFVGPAASDAFVDNIQAVADQAEYESQVSQGIIKVRVEPQGQLLNVLTDILRRMPQSDGWNAAQRALLLKFATDLSRTDIAYRTMVSWVNGLGQNAYFATYGEPRLNPDGTVVEFDDQLHTKLVEEGKNIYDELEMIFAAAILYWIEQGAEQVVSNGNISVFGHFRLQAANLTGGQSVETWGSFHPHAQTIPNPLSAKITDAMKEYLTAVVLIRSGEAVLNKDLEAVLESDSTREVILGIAEMARKNKQFAWNALHPPDSFESILEDSVFEPFPSDKNKPYNTLENIKEEFIARKDPSNVLIALLSLGLVRANAQISVQINQSMEVFDEHSDPHLAAWAAISGLPLWTLFNMSFSLDSALTRSPFETVGLADFARESHFNSCGNVGGPIYNRLMPFVGWWVSLQARLVDKCTTFILRHEEEVWKHKEFAGTPEEANVMLLTVLIQKLMYVLFPNRARSEE